MSNKMARGILRYEFPREPSICIQHRKRGLRHLGNQVVDLNNHCLTLALNFFLFCFKKKRDFHSSGKPLMFFASLAVKSQGTDIEERNLLNIFLRLSFNDNSRIAGLESGNCT